MGGYQGIATALGCVVEYTKDAGAHAHGLCSLLHVYSQSTLQEISHILQVNATTHGDGVLQRIKKLVNHVQRSSYCQPSFHEEHSSMLEEAFNS
eukprot:11918339-Karenia_brevis.AAC.1